MENNINERNEVGMAEKTKKNRKTMFMIVLVLCLATLGALYVPKLFASNSEKFFALFTPKQNVFSSLYDSSVEQVNFKTKIDIDEILYSIDKTKMDVGEIEFENVSIFEDEDFSNSFTIKAEKLTDKRFELQIVKTGNLVGINLPNITEEFIGVDISDLEGLTENLQKFGLEFDEFEETDETDKERILELVQRYLKVVVKEMDEFIKVEKNEKFEVHGQKAKATAYSLKIDDEVLTKIGLAIEKELIKNEKDLQLIVDMGLYADIEDLKDDIEFDISNSEEAIKDRSYSEILDEEIVLKVYEKDGKNIATVVEVDEIKLGVYLFEEAKDNFVFVCEFSENDNYLLLSIEMKDGKGEVNFELDAEGEKMDLELCEFEVKKLSKAKDKIIKIDKDDILLLNEASEYDLETFSEDVTENLEAILGQVNGDNQLKLEDNKEINNDVKEESKKEIVDGGIQVNSGVLAKAQKLFNKVDIGMTKEEVIELIGEPDDEYKGTYRDTLYYQKDYMDLVIVRVRDNKVEEVEINVFSDSYSKIFIGKELGTAIPDLNNLVNKIKEGMTLNEVKEILGDKCFMSSKDAEGFYAYTWYDLKENELSMRFENGEVWIVYDINEMF